MSRLYSALLLHVKRQKTTSGEQKKKKRLCSESFLPFCRIVRKLECQMVLHLYSSANGTAYIPYDSSKESKEIIIARQTCYLISKPLFPPSLTLECVYNRSHRSFPWLSRARAVLTSLRSSKRRDAERRKWSGHAC